ncbi:MAG: translation initiation factor IF-5A [Candidatus Hodarchaeota archaeon]
MAYEPTRVGSLKVGRFVNDPETNEPCKIISIDKSKPGKHGAAKARIVMMGLFDGRKRNRVSGVDARWHVPIVNKGAAQVTNITREGTIDLMNLETYETFTAPMPPEEDIASKLRKLFESGKGVEAEVWTVMDRKKIMTVREMT